MNTQQASKEELQNDTTVSNEELQWEQSEKETISKDDYTSLQSEYTKTRQREISYAVKLAERDKKSILEIEDRKIQDKVVKELYGLENLEEVKLIHWDNFYEEKSEEDVEDDRLTRLEKELKISKYQQEKLELDRAINDIKSKNPLAFEDSNTEAKLREEVQLISNNLSLEERVKRAAKLVVWNTDDLWRALKQEGGYSPSKKEVDNKEETSKVEDEISSIFKKRFS